MTVRQTVLGRFRSSREREPLYLPDLSLWHRRHRRDGSPWGELSLAELCRALEVPCWLPVSPYRRETAGVEVSAEEEGGRRILRWLTDRGVLEATWTLGPDGEWWQESYPVKSESDLPAAVEIVRQTSYVPELWDVEQAEREAGEDGVVAVEIPQTPYAELLHSFFGWKEGLVLLWQQAEAAGELLQLLAERLHGLVEELATAGGPSLVVAPDNLDARFITPEVFESRFLPDYRRCARTLQRAGRLLVVQAGGPVRRFLPALAEAGVAGVEGICAPPQSDASLAEARQAAGPELTLWGGIAQDLLLPTHGEEEFRAAVRAAVRQARTLDRTLIGVADRVPADALPERLESLPGLIVEAGGS